ncbi:MAG TPA: heavy metal-binding domain-containing protein [Labilithrix sp.]
MIFTFVDARARQHHDGIVRAGRLLFFSIALVGCGSPVHSQVNPYETSAYANPFIPGAAPPAPTDAPLVALPPMPSDPRSPVFAIDSSNVLLTTERRLDRPTQDIGRVQEIVWGGLQQNAMTALRERARALGADAVLGLELDTDPATHLTRMSGTAVRYAIR